MASPGRRAPLPCTVVTLDLGEILRKAAVPSTRSTRNSRAATGGTPREQRPATSGRQPRPRPAACARPAAKGGLGWLKHHAGLEQQVVRLQQECSRLDAMLEGSAKREQAAGAEGPGAAEQRSEPSATQRAGLEEGAAAAEAGPGSSSACSGRQLKGHAAADADPAVDAAPWDGCTLPCSPAPGPSAVSSCVSTPRSVASAGEVCWGNSLFAREPQVRPAAVPPVALERLPQAPPRAPELDSASSESSAVDTASVAAWL